MRERTGVSFECPDVRETEDCSSEFPGEYTLLDGDEATFWLNLKPGLNYVGTCQSQNCPCNRLEQHDEFAGRTVCNVGTGIHRPNEHICDGAIRCPACKKPFQPDRFSFWMCSAKVRFRIENQENDEFSFTED